MTANVLEAGRLSVQEVQGFLDEPSGKAERKSSKVQGKEIKLKKRI